MSKVPAGYSPEPGAQRCGDSYSRQLTVDGRIPGQGLYGSDLSHSLTAHRVPEIAFGVNSPEEGDFDAETRAKIGDVREKLNLESFEFTEKRYRSILRLLDAAEEHLDVAAETTILPVPEGAGLIRSNTVRQLFVDALKHLRCAEYKTYRTLLYNEAKARLAEEGPGPGAGGGGAPTIGGLFAGYPDPVDVPPEPDDDAVLDPADFDAFPGVMPIDTPDSEPPPEPQRAKSKGGPPALLLGALGVGALLLAPRVLK